ncbi:MAG: magnesium transporter [Pseudomonadota bacterium]
MPSTSPELETRPEIGALQAILQSGQADSARKTLQGMHPAEIANVLEGIPGNKRLVVWQLLDDALAGDVLIELNEESRDSLVKHLDSEDLLQAIRHLEVDDIADLVQGLPDAAIPEVLAGMDKQNRQRLESVLSWPEDSAGGLMDLDVVTVRADVSLDVVIRYLRLKGEIPRYTDRLIVVDRFDHYLGVLPIRRLLCNDPELDVAALMRTDVDAIPVETDQHEVIRQFEELDLVSAAVVDRDNKLLGRITVDDVVDAMREEADQQMYGMAGVSTEEDLFGSVLNASRRRAIWLGINLLTALLAAWVIGRFEVALEEIVALAILNPVVASMGGIAGSQTLTLVIRGQALGHLSSHNVRWLLNKEVIVGFVNGVFWATIVALITYLWFGDAELGLIIAAALVINMAAATAAGVAVPTLLRRMGVDPALAGSVVLTTVTDVVGFVAFLGLASAVLLR